MSRPRKDPLRWILGGWATLATAAAITLFAGRDALLTRPPVAVTPGTTVSPTPSEQPTNLPPTGSQPSPPSHTTSRAEELALAPAPIELPLTRGEGSAATEVTTYDIAPTAGSLTIVLETPFGIDAQTKTVVRLVPPSGSPRTIRTTIGDIQRWPVLTYSPSSGKVQAGRYVVHIEPTGTSSTTTFEAIEIPFDVRKKPR